jgi:type IV secretion system protein VirB6
MDALDMVLVAGLVFLLLRQIMPIAAGLAGGPALEGFGAIGRLLRASARLGAAATSGGIAVARLAAMARSSSAVGAGEADVARRSEILSWREPI